ncbi:MAG: glycosyltransferase family 4 protein [Helicobacteraceae bacterium]|jgi:UDP-glucose:(heptosyl)LPS alpha-1,3-glucosyltransferase|nr:glycosyltransferase family 4 protein [Helicobacteraceae bacterium]
MRVAIAKKDMGSAKTAASNIVLEQTAFLSKIGHEVFVIAEHFGKYGKEKVEAAGGRAVKAFKLPPLFGKGRYLRRRFFANRAQAWIKRHRMDFVIGHGDIMRQNLLYMHNCVHLAHERLTGRPLPANHDVGRMHGELLQSGIWDILICSSEMMRADLIRRFNLTAKKTMVIYPAFDVQRFEASKDERGRLRREVREQFKIEDETILISLITSGDLRVRNAYGLIDAFEMIASVGNAKLFIAAKEKFAPFIAYTENRGLKDRVIFAPPIDDVRRYFFASDIFALPAFIETFARACIEAMFCSLPVLVSPFVGASEILIGKSRRFILPDLRTESIAEGLRTLIENPVLCNELGEINRGRAKNFSAQDALARMNALLTRQKL